MRGGRICTALQLPWTDSRRVRTFGSTYLVVQRICPCSGVGFWRRGLWLFLLPCHVKRSVNYEFAQTSTLPSRPPEDWGSAMANRTFKVRVVARVLDVTRAWFELKLKTDQRFAGRTLVLD